MKKKNFAFGICAFAVALGLAACGDDASSAGPSETEEISSSAEVVIASSSSAMQSCSSAGPSETEKVSSSNSVILSSESEESSSSQKANSSSTAEVVESSSSVIASSSSAMQSCSSVVFPAEVKTSGYYDCDIYHCVTTDYLKQTMLENGVYGEILDTRDNQVYKVVVIGEGADAQIWMAQNLNYDPGDVSGMSSYAWSGCPNNKADSCAKYGRLYTWEVAMDNAGCGYGTYCNNSYEGTQGVCPSGWHLPTKEEWQQLVKPMAYSVDDYTTQWDYNGAGVELKTVDGWSYYPNTTAGTNASSFSALPAGSRYSAGHFRNSGSYASFWSASESNVLSAYSLNLYYGSDDAYLDYNYKNYAFSVRCVQNN